MKKLIFIFGLLFFFTQPALANPILEVAKCASGLHLNKADIDDSIFSLGSAYVQISIAHNSNSRNTNLIVLVEELEEDPRGGLGVQIKPHSAICTILKDIQYSFDTGTIFSNHLEHRGILGNVFGIGRKIPIRDNIPSGARSLCSFTRIALLEEDGSRQDVIRNSGYWLRQARLVFPHTLYRDNPSYRELEQKCMALKRNELNRS